MWRGFSGISSAGAGLWFTICLKHMKNTIDPLFFTHALSLHNVLLARRAWSADRWPFSAIWNLGLFLMLFTVFCEASHNRIVFSNGFSTQFTNTCYLQCLHPLTDVLIAIYMQSAAHGKFSLFFTGIWVHEFPATAEPDSNWCETLFPKKLAGKRISLSEDPWPSAARPLLCAGAENGDAYARLIYTK